MSVQHVSYSRPSGCDFRRCRRFPKGLVLGGLYKYIHAIWSFWTHNLSPFFPSDQCCLYLMRRSLSMAPIRTDSPSRHSQRNSKSRPASLQNPNTPSLPANDDIKVESGYLMQKMLRIVDLFEEEAKWSHMVCKAMGFIM